MIMTFFRFHSWLQHKQKNEYRTILEEEKKINALKDSHEWDSSETKDQLSLSSTSLPDVGIHEPQFHVKG